MTTTTTSVPDTIIGPSRVLSDFAMMLASDIDPKKFADRCGTTINHPAFVLGHCAYFLGVAVTMLGGTIEFDADEENRFNIGIECQDDASLYKNKDDMLAFFVKRATQVAEFLETCDESVFAQPVTDGPFAGRFTTMGQVAAFMVMGHTSFHLGQLSAWRRVAGMAPAMGG